MSDRFVNAYRIDTGEKQRIPRHWLDHPTLGAKFRLTPKAAAKERRDRAAEQTASPPPETPADPAASSTDSDAPLAPADLDTSTTHPSNPDTAAEPKE